MQDDVSESTKKSATTCLNGMLVGLTASVRKLEQIITQYLIGSSKNEVKRKTPNPTVYS